MRLRRPAASSDYDDGGLPCAGVLKPQARAVTRVGQWVVHGQFAGASRLRRGGVDAGGDEQRGDVEQRKWPLPVRGRTGVVHAGREKSGLNRPRDVGYQLRPGLAPAQPTLPKRCTHLPRIGATLGAVR